MHLNIPLNFYHLRCLPVTVTSENNISVRSVDVNLTGLDPGSQGELNRSSVDNTDDVSTSGGLNLHEEGTVETILSVELNNLLVVVGALKQLNTGVQGTSVSLEEHTHSVDGRVKGVSTKGSSLDDHGGLTLDISGNGHILGGNTGSQGELDLTNVADGNGVGSTRGLNDGRKGTDGSILNVHAHLARGVIGTLPELDISVHGTSLGLQSNLNTLDGGGCVGPGLEGVSLDNEGGTLVPEASTSTTSGHTAAGLEVVDAGVDASITSKGTRLKGGRTVSIDITSNVQGGAEGGGSLVSDKSHGRGDGRESEKAVVDLHGSFFS
mmetsp:Transcript_2730/g.4242  ORF Transcript_2730/g.4242 Transcript_2730/m.4242 type:complete len:323 (-) Transcript_2730:588-1556(-)